MRIALIGYGKMGAAMMSQWMAVADRSFPDHRFTIIDPTLADRDPPPADTDRATFLAEPPPADARFDLIVFAVKPQMLDKVVPGYAGRLADGGFVASIAAGSSIARLKSLAGDAPTVRIMPNLPAAIGEGVSGLCADAAIAPAQRDAVEALMAAVGTAIWVGDEDKLDRLTAVAGSGPGYVFEIARAYVEAARALGFDEADSRALVLGTLAGTVEMARRSSEGLADLRESVTSKAGTTAAGLAALNGDGSLDRLFRTTLDAAYARAVELR